MTPAEKMAKNLEGDPLYDDLREAPALIRRLAAAFAYALDNMPMDQYLQLKQRHADALRDVKEQA